METLRQINIKNRPHYFFNSMTNINKFDLRLLSINEISFKSTDDVIFDIEYITMKSSDGAKSLYLVFNNVDAYFDYSSTGEKYLVFAFTDKNREALEIYTELRDEIKYQIEIISHVRPTKYEKDFMKLNLNQMMTYLWVNIPVCVIIARSVFQEDDKY